MDASAHPSQQRIDDALVVPFLLQWRSFCGRRCTEILTFRVDSVLGKSSSVGRNSQFVTIHGRPSSCPQSQLAEHSSAENPDFLPVPPFRPTFSSFLTGFVIDVSLEFEPKRTHSSEACHHGWFWILPVAFAPRRFIFRRNGACSHQAGRFIHT